MSRLRWGRRRCAGTRPMPRRCCSISSAPAGRCSSRSQTWQTITSPRPRPRPDDMLDLTGRTVDSASTALALVALAGVVAVLATRGRRAAGGRRGGRPRRCRAGVARRSPRPVRSSASRARSLVAQRHRAVVLDPGVTPHVAVHAIWPALSVAAGVLVLLAGAAIAARGHRWGGMSARYENVRAAARRVGPGGPRVGVAVERAGPRRGPHLALDRPRDAPARRPDRPARRLGPEHTGRTTSTGGSGGERP